MPANPVGLAGSENDVLDPRVGIASTTEGTAPSSSTGVTESPDSPPHLPPNAGRTARLNLLRLFLPTTLTRRSATLLALSLALSAVQVAGCAAALALSNAQACDAPLRLFLALHIARVVLVTPLVAFRHTHPRPPRGTPDTVIGQWIDRFKSLLDVLATLWFVVGNWWLFTSTSCSSTSPPLFYASLALVIAGYLMLAIPVVLCASVVFCLPCVLGFMRVFRLGDPLGRSGVSEDVLKKVQLVRFTSKPDASSGAERRSSFLARLQRSSGDMPALYLESEDANCVICLSAYEEGDVLRKLRCGHHFHKECGDRWLRISGKCPICLRAVSDDDANEGNGTGDSEQRGTERDLERAEGGVVGGRVGNETTGDPRRSFALSVQSSDPRPSFANSTSNLVSPSQETELRDVVR